MPVCAGRAPFPSSSPPQRTDMGLSLSTEVFSEGGGAGRRSSAFLFGFTASQNGVHYRLAKGPLEDLGGHEGF